MEPGQAFQPGRAGEPSRRRTETTAMCAFLDAARHRHASAAGRLAIRPEPYRRCAIQAPVAANAPRPQAGTAPMTAPRSRSERASRRPNRLRLRAGAGWPPEELCNSPLCKIGRSKSSAKWLRETCANMPSINGRCVALERVLGPSSCVGGAPADQVLCISAILDLIPNGTNGLRIEVAPRAKAEGMWCRARVRWLTSCRALPARP
jgi:hypothetical protein